MKHCLAFCLAAASLSAFPAGAEPFAPVKDLQTFLQLVEGRDLRIGIYDLTLQLSPGGQITGEALGWSITGSWRWEDSFFCRQMDWSGYAIKDNCQLVEVEGSDELRFTVDKGEGQSATFRLR